ncbi:hypothetical protein GOODEAATRI_005254 [Goodea atripinnis]|uniref:Transmembrane protein n=1 Tax=Goodea atripinnis TaxID=208336 RepID=A0ABV0PBN1_9TELE
MFQDAVVPTVHRFRLGDAVAAGTNTFRKGRVILSLLLALLFWHLHSRCGVHFDRCFNPLLWFWFTRLLWNNLLRVLYCLSAPYVLRDEIRFCIFHLRTFILCLTFLVIFIVFIILRTPLFFNRCSPCRPRLSASLSFLLHLFFCSTSCPPLRRLCFVLYHLGVSISIKTGFRCRFCIGWSLGRRISAFNTWRSTFSGAPFGRHEEFF